MVAGTDACLRLYPGTIDPTLNTSIILSWSQNDCSLWGIIIDFKKKEVKMKSLRIISVLLVCIFFSATVFLYAQEQNTNKIIEQLNQELEKDKVFTRRELRTIKKPVKNMLDKGATKEDLKNMLKDLSRSGVRGKDLENTVNAANDLVNNGENPKEAGNIVSQAAHAAQAQGLKGRDLAAKVHEAIRQRKQEREKTKKTKQEEGKRKEKGKEESGRVPAGGKCKDCTAKGGKK
jgi:hypothetical protein